MINGEDVKKRLSALENADELVKVLAGIHRHTGFPCDHIHLLAATDGKMEVLLDVRMKSMKGSLPIRVTVNVAYTPSLHATLCSMLESEGWAVKPRDHDDGFRALFDNSRTLRLPDRPSQPRGGDVVSPPLERAAPVTKKGT